MNKQDFNNMSEWDIYVKRYLRAIKAQNYPKHPCQKAIHEITVTSDE